MCGDGNEMCASYRVGVKAWKTVHRQCKRSKYTERAKQFCGVWRSVWLVVIEYGGLRISYSRRRESLTPERRVPPIARRIECYNKRPCSPPAYRPPAASRSPANNTISKRVSPTKSGHRASSPSTSAVHHHQTTASPMFGRHSTQERRIEGEFVIACSCGQTETGSSSPPHS